MTELLTSPTFVALIQAAGVGLLVILAAVSQRFGNRREKEAPASKDVVVPSLAIADTQAITHMADTLREANRVARDHREHDTEILYELKALRESHQRIESMLGRMLDQMRGPRRR